MEFNGKSERNLRTWCVHHNEMNLCFVVFDMLAELPDLRCQLPQGWIDDGSRSSGEA